MDRARRERDERTTAKRPEAMGGGRRRENRPSSINNTKCNCPTTAPWSRAVNCKEAYRRTMEETRGGEEERTTGQGDGWGEQPSAWSLRENDRTMEKRRV